MYYNYCSGWMHPWYWYCFSEFGFCDHRYGTCFDLADCPEDCRILEDVWWACQAYGGYNYVDIEIYCADEDDCPLGPPLAGIYDYEVDDGGYPWEHVDFGGLPLCGCTGTSRFIVMIVQDAGHIVWPYADLNYRNLDDGCESEWRCTGHSFVYQGTVSYCNAYGVPAPLWGSWAGAACTEYPAVPPSCHNYHYDTGFYAEWLIDCYISCQGPTQTENRSWSEVKALYR
jgi:hypothetical protein